MESWGDLAKQLWWEMTPQTNYHGSPYTFNKFDDSKFLTGEGFMAHGPGHYSADSLDTAKWYKSKGGDRVLKYNGNIFDTKKMPSLIGDIDYYKSLKKYNNIDRLNSIRNELLDNLNTYNNWLDNYDSIPLREQAFSMKKDHIVNMINSAKTRINALDNLDKYTIEQGGNLYKVNVPNENFMWKEGFPIDLQSNYIKNRVIPSVNEIKNIKNLEDLEDVVYKFGMLDNRYEPLSVRDNFIMKRIEDGKIEPSRIGKEIGRIKNRLIEERNTLSSITPKVSDRMANNLKDVGIKGIRANGRRDGGINVTFTGKDIKMANTIPQQIRNRIPVQTLGKMARKLYNYPAVKGGIKFLDMFGPYLMVPDMIKLTHPQLYPYTNKEKQNMKNILERKYGIKINGNRITI